MELSDFFVVSVGLKQGEPLSPLLFILFINDVKNTLHYELNRVSENDLNLLQFLKLLLADDIVIFSTDPNCLQEHLNSLYWYSTKWGLKINTVKTKMCIIIFFFEKRKQHHNLEFKINNDVLEIVGNSTSLGVNLAKTGNMRVAVKLWRTKLYEPTITYCLYSLKFNLILK